MDTEKMRKVLYKGIEDLIDEWKAVGNAKDSVRTFLIYEGGVDKIIDILYDVIDEVMGNKREEAPPIEMKDFKIKDVMIDTKKLISEMEAGCGFSPLGVSLPSSWDALDHDIGLNHEFDSDFDDTDYN